MNLEQFASGDGQFIREYTYTDGTVIAVDFGTAAADSTAEVVDGTVIVVIGDDQHEFELPAAVNDAQAFIKNGVLSIELEDTA